MTKRREIFSALLPMMLLTLGQALLLPAVFPSLNVTWQSAWLYLCVGSALLYALQRTRLWKWFLAGACIAAAVSAVCAYHSFSYLVYDACAAMQRATGHIYLTADPHGRLLPLRVFLLLVCALLHSRAAVTGKPYYLLPMLIPVLEGCILAILPVGTGTAFLAIGLLLTFGLCGTHWRVALQRCAAVLLCAALTAGVGFVLRDVPQERAATRLRFALHALVFDKGSGVLSEGDLARLGAFPKEETPALAVTMEQPQTMYLRGSIYETYTGTSWLPLSAETRDEYGAFFAWIHANGFYGQSQIYTISTTVDTPDTQTVRIRNLSACRAHGYLPYGAGGELPLDETLIGDAQIPSKARAFSCIPMDADALRSAARKLSSGAFAPLARMEQSMSAYASNVDISIPQDVRELLARECDLPTTGTTDELLRGIRAFLQRTLAYDESVRTRTNDDFLQTVFTTRRGYSVHYATAAVMLLRRCGIPSRYVEGYYLSPQKAQDAVAGEEIVLTKADAHAWAEYYVDGVGFVPFEVTPGYVDAQEQPQETHDERALEHRPQTPVDVPQMVPAQQPVDLQPETAYAWQWLLLLLILLPGGWFLWQRLRLYRLRRVIAASDDREAILQLYGYACALRRLCPSDVPGSKEARALYDLARFSDHVMTAAQRKEMESYCGTVRDVCLRSWSLPQMLRYRILRGIFLPLPRT